MPDREPSSLTEHHQALRLFTDRLPERRRFLDYLHADPPREQILFFHGDGGNGKSLLLKLLHTDYCRRLAPDAWQRLAALADDAACVDGYLNAAATPAGALAIPWVYHDFAEPLNQQGDPACEGSALIRLRRALGAQGLRLPLFDYALLLYLHRTGSLPPGGIKTLFPQDEADLAVSLYELVANPDLPIVGTATKVIGCIAKFFQADLGLWWAAHGLDDARLAALRGMEPRPTLREALPRLLGESINAAMQAPGAPPRLALLFDTHESFWGSRRHHDSALGYFERDEWFRDLLLELYRPNHGVIVAVAGREPPRWAEAPEGETRVRAERLDTQLVGHLERTDATDYLRRALAPAGPDPAADAALHDAMVRYTEVEPGQVHPLYLGLAADLVLRARARGEALTADAFAPEATANRPDLGPRLAARLLAYCDRELESGVKALAAARRFDRALYFDLGARLRFDSSQAAFETLAGLSFVWPEDPVSTAAGGPADPARFRIHGLLRRVLADLYPAETQAAHAALEAIHRGRAEAAAPADPQAQAESIAEAIYHANRQDWERGYLEWFEVMEDALANARYPLAEALAGLRPLLRLETPFAEARVAGRVGALALDLSRHREAEAALGEAVLGYERQLAQEPDDIAAHNNRGDALCKIGDLHRTRDDPAGAESVYTAAIAATDEALARAPDAVIGLANRGDLMRKLAELDLQRGDPAAACQRLREARTWLDRALTLAPNHRELAAESALVDRLLEAHCPPA